MNKSLCTPIKTLISNKIVIEMHSLVTAFINEEILTIEIVNICYKQQVFKVEIN